MVRYFIRAVFFISLLANIFLRRYILYTCMKILYTHKFTVLRFLALWYRRPYFFVMLYWSILGMLHPKWLVWMGPRLINGVKVTKENKITKFQWGKNTIVRLRLWGFSHGHNYKVNNFLRSGRPLFIVTMKISRLSLESGIWFDFLGKEGLSIVGYRYT